MDEFSAPTGIRMNGHVGIVEYGGGDRGMVCMFYNKALHNPAKSTAGGKPHYDDITFVRIHPPGERLNIVDRKATDADKRRFPVQWAQYQQQKEQIPEGTPIDLLYPEHPSIAATMRAHGVHTVEQCAELSANALETIGMGAQRYCNDAKRYIELAERGVKASQLRNELETRDREIAILKRTVEDLKTQINNQEGQHGALTQEQVLQAVASLMARPQHLPGKAFDPQTAQINAVNPETRGTTRQPRKRQKL
jgi:hypothetical protein